MKKLIASLSAAIVLLATLLCLASCGNMQVFDTTYRFDYAIVKFPDGSCQKIEIKSWTDYEDGEQLQITAMDGTTYLVNSVNCVLVSEAKD